MCRNIIFSLGYRFIIPDEVINYPKYGCYNIHKSLLPLNKGANPGNLQATLIAAAMQIGINFGRDAHLITIVTILSALLKETEKMMEFIPYEDEGEQNAKH